MSAHQTPYNILGEDGIRALVDAFYDIMDSDPEFADLRTMHTDDLTQIRDRLTEYLTGWFGGPPIYSEKYGSICLTDPHKPYKIGVQARDQWLRCMDKALEQTDTSAEFIQMLKQPFFMIAETVRNQEG